MDALREAAQLDRFLCDWMKLRTSLAVRHGLFGPSFLRTLFVYLVLAGATACVDELGVVDVGSAQMENFSSLPLMIERIDFNMLIDEEP